MTTPPIDLPDWGNPVLGLEVMTPVLAAQVMNPAGVQGPFDLSAYNAIALWVSPSAAGANVQVFDVESNQEIATLTTPADPLSVAAGPIVVPVTSKSVRVVNNGSEALSVSLYASSRPVERTIPLRQAMDPETLGTANQAQAGTVELGYGTGYGPVFSEFTVTGATLTGTFNVHTGSSDVQVADTAEMHTAPSGGGRTIFKPWIAPRGRWRMQFIVAATSTAVVRARNIYGP